MYDQKLLSKFATLYCHWSYNSSSAVFSGLNNFGFQSVAFTNGILKGVNMFYVSFVDDKDCVCCSNYLNNYLIESWSRTAVLVKQKRPNADQVWMNFFKCEKVMQFNVWKMQEQLIKIGEISSQ